MDVTIDTSQIRILQDFFENLSHADQKKIFTTAYRRAARPLVAAAKIAAPYRSGVLQRSIGTIEVPDQNAILVGAKLAGAYKGWYGNFTESGTKERFRKTMKNASTGRVNASHWFERAYDMTEKQVFDSITDEWYQAIDRMITQTNRRLR